jgi:hypothetical protein
LSILLPAATAVTATPATAATNIPAGCASTASTLPEGFELLEGNGFLTCAGGRWVFQPCDPGTRAYGVAYGRVFCS